MKIATLSPSGLRAAARTLKPGAGAAERGNDLVTMLRWAQGAPDIGDRAAVEAALGRTLATFFARPGEIDIDPYRYRIRTPDGASAPAAAAVVAVVRAARGRLRLTRDGVIDSPDLAALASADESYIRRLARAGVLARAGEAPRAPITAASAVQLLQRRGVAGFTEAA